MNELNPPYERQLALDVDENRLPWLDSVDDEPENEGGAVRFASIVGAVFLLVAALGGGLYWWLQANGSADGDGSLIAAPVGPYKEKPKDPQMVEVEGTGDASYGVSQGEQPVARLAVKEAAPKPSNAVLVQLGAYGNEDGAKAGWTTLTQANPFLSGMQRRIAPAQVDGGTVYRLSAVAGNLAEANNVCDQLKKAGENCLVIR